MCGSAPQRAWGGRGRARDRLEPRGGRAWRGGVGRGAELGERVRERGESPALGELRPPAISPPLCCWPSPPPAFSRPASPGTLVASTPHTVNLTTQRPARRGNAFFAGETGRPAPPFFSLGAWGVWPPGGGLRTPAGGRPRPGPAPRPHRQAPCECDDAILVASAPPRTEAWARFATRASPFCCQQPLPSQARHTQTVSVSRGRGAVPTRAHKPPLIHGRRWW